LSLHLLINEVKINFFEPPVLLTLPYESIFLILISKFLGNTLTNNHYHLEIKSDPNNLIAVEEFVNSLAKDIGIDEDKKNGLLLSVTEATTNAIIHANKCDINKKVEINVNVENGFLIVKVKDEGTGFDPKNIPDPTSPENILKDSGRGLYLMRVYMDELKYNVTPSGTETILILKIK
jgi:serine/threonine-protein kinase RsbW